MASLAAASKKLKTDFRLYSYKSVDLKNVKSLRLFKREFDSQPIVSADQATLENVLIKVLGRSDRYGNVVRTQIEEDKLLPMTPDIACLLKNFTEVLKKCPPINFPKDDDAFRQLVADQAKRELLTLRHVDNVYQRETLQPADQGLGESICIFQDCQ